MNEEKQENEDHALKESMINEEKQEYEDNVIVPTMMNGLFGVQNYGITRIDKANATTTDTEDEKAGKLNGL
eukprot:CAMPEP_0198253168 /NCGR_PEP_ID=MMETSP1447-20131203/3616_1 /TAXON_ID=420782 /ORGANISM="Chaetoceros dichaeta, Strain CCMP1751" /LENGTH=70 /DNA_ID=CAMNT_0043938713 /DNA_START=24 /DNA_END=233 /DNA_ORIENTATION=-